MTLKYLIAHERKELRNLLVLQSILTILRGSCGRTDTFCAEGAVGLIIFMMSVRCLLENASSGDSV